jgi:hypothetical protein
MVEAENFSDHPLNNISRCTVLWMSNTFSCLRILCCTVFFFLWLDSPSGSRPPDCRDFETTLRHTKLGRTPMDEWSARRGDLYLTAHSKHNRFPCSRLGTSGCRPKSFTPRCPRDRHTVYVPWFKTSAHRTDIHPMYLIPIAVGNNVTGISGLSQTWLWFVSWHKINQGAEGFFKLKSPSQR